MRNWTGEASGPVKRCSEYADEPAVHSRHGARDGASASTPRGRLPVSGGSCTLDRAPPKGGHRVHPPACCGVRRRLLLAPLSRARHDVRVECGVVGDKARAQTSSGMPRPIVSSLRLAGPLSGSGSMKMPMMLPCVLRRSSRGASSHPLLAAEKDDHLLWMIEDRRPVSTF